MLLRALYFIAALGAVIIGVTLWAWGQPLISASGEVKLWVGLIWSSGNSQHIADWYTLSHVVHGMLIILVGRALFGWVGYPVLVVAAIVTGMAWEIVEHTEWVLGKFRAATIYQGYLGDTVLNAVADYISMWAGFFLARAIATLWVFLLIVVMEVTSALLGRDCLTFTTLTFFFTIDANEEYQKEINPRYNPVE